MSWYSQIAWWKNRRLARIPADTFPTPTITSCTPTSVTPLGGTVVVITGTGFMAAAPRPDVGTSFVEEVWFGLLAATSYVVDSATQITAVAPAQAAGTIYVVVNTQGSGASALGPVSIAVESFYILAETGDVINAENSDRLRTEQNG